MPDEQEVVTGEQPATSDSAEGSSTEEATPEIPQEKWEQLMKKAKNEAKKEFYKEISSLGIQQDDKEEKDPMTLLRSELESLKESNARKDCEATHPVLRDEKYSEEWQKLCEEKRPLIQSGTLSHDDLYHLVIGKLGLPEPEKKPTSTSVPPFSKNAPTTTSSSPENVKQWYRSQINPDTGRNFTDEEWRKLNEEN